MTAEERAARRALILQHHPDRGGDTARFVQILDDLDARAATHPTTTGAPSGSRMRRRRALARELRAHLPRGLPGARRYATY